MMRNGCSVTAEERFMIEAEPLKILVVDDTVIFRKAVSDIVSSLPDVELVGTAGNGKIALTKIGSLKPDLLILDIEMPEMNGLDVLQHMKADFPDVGAIVLSTLTRKGGETTLRALELGAFDFIPKPDSGEKDRNLKEIRDALAPMLKAFNRRREVKAILKGKMAPPPSRAGVSTEVPSHITGKPWKTTTGKRAARSEIVGIGVSTGGPNALAEVLPKLPADIGVPILLVQHMPPVFTQSLAESLNAKCAIDVREAVDGQTIEPNTALIAPGGKQMRVAAGADGTTRIVRVTNDPPENNCKPSVDHLFRSISRHYVGRATGVIMTGMGSDGTLGLKLMKRNGASIIAQDEASCVVFGMPKEPIEAGIVDVIAPLDHIAQEICRMTKPFGGMNRRSI